MDVLVGTTDNLSGCISAPPSKAYTHRMLIASALSNGISKIYNPLVSEDTQATLDAVRAFGVIIEIGENCWIVHGQETLKNPKEPIDCRESGSTLRFMIPVAALASGTSVFLFAPSFERRPIEPLLKSLDDLGVKSTVKKDNSTVLVYGGGINGGKTSIRGDISSQFISGLLFSCPKAKEYTEISVTTPLESVGYVEMTLEILVKHGLEGTVSHDLSRLGIPSNQSYCPHDHEVPGDFSSASFLMVAAAITSSCIRITNLDCNTHQGDREILDILQDMGAIVNVTENEVEIQGDHLDGIDIDARNIPDLVPVCTVLGCYAEGRTEIYNAKRLRLKESDRLDSISSELVKMGADISVKPDSITVKGGSQLNNTTINPHNDHRIAMACAIAALGAKGETKIQDAECINKSYPQFFTDLHKLGANIVGA